MLLYALQVCAATLLIAIIFDVARAPRETGQEGIDEKTPPPDCTDDGGPPRH